MKDQDIPVELVGIGKDNNISYVDNWTDNNDAAVCADESPFNVWSDWGASQRDLFLLDFNGELVLHQNITSGIPDDLSDIIIGLLNPNTDPCDLGVVYVSEAHTSGDPEDYIELYNSGDTDCSLEGFQLDDSEDLEDLTFGAVIIPAGGYWIGYEDQDSSFSSGLSANGGIIVFADSNNNTLVVTLGESQELDGVELSQSFDANGVGCYTNPTPGAANGDCMTLGNDTDTLLPRLMTLHQNYPNPFNPVTTLRYDLAKDVMVNISIYDMNGNLVRNLIRENQTAGQRSVKWNATNQIGQPVSAGVYLYSIEADGLIQTRKMILLK